MLRKSQGSIFKAKCFLLAKNWLYVIIAFKILKAEVKFEYTR